MPQNQELTELIADVKEQVLYLQELGVESFDIELVASPTERPARLVRDKGATPPPSVISQAHTSAPPAATSPRRPAGSRLAALPSLKNRNTHDVNAGSTAPVSLDKEDKEITTLNTAPAAATGPVQEPT